MRAEYGVDVYGANEGHVALFDHAYEHGVKRGIVWCHGHSIAASPCLQLLADQVDAGHIPKAISAEGYPIIAADLALNSWGNDTAKTRIGLCKTYIQGTAGGALSGKVLLVGGSMGTIAACNYALANPTLVQAIALLLGPPNVDAIHSSNRNGYAAEIDSQYPGGWSGAKATHDPAIFAASLLGIPIKCWYGDIDPLVLPAEVEAFATASGADLQKFSGSHTTAFINPNEILEFLDANA